MSWVIIGVSALLILGGIVASARWLIQGQALKAGLLFLFSVAAGSLQILWSRFFKEDDARGGPEKSDWRNWLSDYLVIVTFGSALVLELYIYGTSEPWVIAILSAILFPFVFVQYGNWLRLVGSPSLGASYSGSWAACDFPSP